MAGTAVDLLFFPIDTIKTRLQSAQGFARAGGFRGMYKGIGSVVVGSAPGGMPYPYQQNRIQINFFSICLFLHL